MLVGVDVGGTKIEVSLVKGDKVVKKTRRQTEADKGSDAVLNNIADAIVEVFSDDVEAVGVGLAGPFDPEKGVMIQSPHISCLVGFPIGDHLEERFKVRVAVDNDARMFTRGVLEFEYKGVRNLVGLTLGTGVGGAVVTDGKMEENPRETSEEVGHMVVEEGGRNCACGGRGCIEAYASGRAMEERYMELTGESLDAKSIVEKADGRDEAAKRVVEEAGAYLARGFAAIVDKFKPEVIAIGGGVSEATALLRIARVEFDKLRLNVRVRIEKSRLKDATLLGAAWFAARS
ncbi:MAG: ROK family protein [Candidatus Hydrothermarchaeaceae archaeon]